MKTGRSAEIFSKDVNPRSSVNEKNTGYSPRFFRHRNLFDALEAARTINRTDLNNLLNSIHFVGKHVYVLLHHPDYKDNILAKAYPEPSFGKTLICRWADVHLPESELEKCDFLNLVINDGQFVVLVPISLDNRSPDSFSVHLPESGYIVNRRKGRRYACHDVAVELLQHDLQIKGEMIDYTPKGFRIRVEPNITVPLTRLGPGVPISIHMRLGKKVIFSTTCLCLRHERVLNGTDIVLTRENKKPKRALKKNIRNPRQQLVPAPKLIFEHPFLKKTIRLDVFDLSTSGFCIFEDQDKGVLIEDLVIPKISIDFLGALRLSCSAKVVYQLREKGKGLRSGFSILDMDIGHYSRLTHILTKALDPHAHIFDDVDMDRLWKFFFDTGFIYPKKYRGMYPHREEIKETYRKLYHENPDIVRHFTYQRNGEIYGHMSMVRAYEKSWMIHHHAAKNMEGKRAGFMVLKQILHYLVDISRLPSANMDYVMCYFRPENKFPYRVYGDFMRAIGNRRVCSIDMFSYFLHPSHATEGQMPKGWSLQKCSKQDRWELSRFYNRVSGGLFFDTVYPKRKYPINESVETLYSQVGLTRKWRTYSLNHDEELKAVLIVNQSDPGLNFSELLNSITIQIIDPTGLTWEVISAAINQLTFIYQKEKIPILIYPHNYLKGRNIPDDTKKYMLFILEARLIRDFAMFLQRELKIRYW